jgi:hypothetical protein
MMGSKNFLESGKVRERETMGTGRLMNLELEAYFAAAQTAPASLPRESQEQEEERASFPSRFLEIVDSIIKPAMESTAETLELHGYGATVEVVRELGSSDPNTFPYAIMHFSPERCPPSDLAYIYTLQGASISFICRRSLLSIEAVTCYPASRGIERRVGSCFVNLVELSPERVSRIVTDAVKQVIRL